MPDVGVTIAVIRDGQILLTKREDFGIWVLPGGGIEAGESIAQAAVRETYEETGLEVELTRLVGIYSRPTWPIGNGGGAHSILFAAKVTGGVVRPQPEEVVEAAFFEPDRLPSPMVWWHRRPVQDAMNGKGGGVVWLQNVELPFAKNVTRLTRQELYELRDRGELPLEKMFERLCGVPTPKDEILEVKG
ncbi:MAG: hypothetical protein B6I34_09105 [Anaerolineaceae bacterium 4572_32.1]|nr:MAG: hypothetical protein B6I34_09105 [Anaerolineaceae bacterium 4572_32.1]